MGRSAVLPVFVLLLVWSSTPAVIHIVDVYGGGDFLSIGEAVTGVVWVQPMVPPLPMRTRLLRGQDTIKRAIREAGAPRAWS